MARRFEAGIALALFSALLSGCEREGSESFWNREGITTTREVPAAKGSPAGGKDNVGRERGRAGEGRVIEVPMGEAPPPRAVP